MLTATQQTTIEMRLKSMAYGERKPILNKSSDVIHAIRAFIKQNPYEGIYLADADATVCRVSAGEGYRLSVRLWCRNIPPGTTVKISEPPDSKLVAHICEYIGENQLAGLEFDSSYKKLSRLDMSKYFTDDFISKNIIQ
jgi:hypothetical protein